MSAQHQHAGAAERNFHLPPGYRHRAEPAYFNDADFDASAVIHQPEVYVLADYLCGVMGRGTIVDLGCGCGRKLARTQASRRIGLDFGDNLAFVRRRHPNVEAREAEFESSDALPLADVDPSGAVVVCADVIEHLKEPRRLLAAMGDLYERGAVIVLSTPDRERVYDGSQLGPPLNPSHTREWTLTEFIDLLSAEIAPPAFAGRTISNTQDLTKNTSLCVLDRQVRDAMDDAKDPADRPLAIVATYNDRDIVRQLALAQLAEGLDLYFLDNWSTDGTHRVLGELAALHSARIGYERFPANGPSGEYDWRAILRRKAEIAARYPGRWVLHVDSDELLRPPWPGMPLARALDVVRRTGANMVDFAVLNFVPTVDGFGERDDPLSFFSHFEFGVHPAHFVQRRAWIQLDKPVDIATNGGHDPIFTDRKMFPYRFVNQHYPIRSQDQGLRKIFQERRPRYARAELAMGWHNHYQGVGPSDALVRPAESLEPWFAQSRQGDYVVEIISDAVLRRIHGSLLP